MGEYSVRCLPDDSRVSSGVRPTPCEHPVCGESRVHPRAGRTLVRRGVRVGFYGECVLPARASSRPGNKSTLPSRSRDRAPPTRVAGVSGVCVARHVKVYACGSTCACVRSRRGAVGTGSSVGKGLGAGPSPLSGKVRVPTPRVQTASGRGPGARRFLPRTRALHVPPPAADVSTLSRPRLASSTPPSAPVPPRSRGSPVLSVDASRARPHPPSTLPGRG